MCEPQREMKRGIIRVYVGKGQALDGKEFFRLPFEQMMRSYSLWFRAEPRWFNGPFEVTQVIRTRLALRGYVGYGNADNGKSRGKKGKAGVSVR